jgi:hypothetical protein
VPLRADLANVYALEGLGDPRARWLVDLRDASGAGVRIDPWGEADDLVVSYRAWGKPTSVTVGADRITGTWSGGRAIYLDSRAEHPEPNNPEVWPGLRITLHVPSSRVPAASTDGKIRFAFPVVAGWDLYDFHLQPVLTPEEVAEGCIRPEHVVDSLAVYHATKGGLNPAAFANRKTGKACHLYRPWLRDSLGRFAWGAWEIDAATQTLVKAFPASVLTGAQWYDVDADFGDTDGQGATGISTLAGYCYWSARSQPGAGNGTLNSISIYAAGTGAQKSRLAIYADATSLPSAFGEQTAEITETNGSWVTGAADSAYALTDDGRYYWIGWLAEANFTSRYDALTAGMKYKTGYTYGANPFPANPATFTNLDRILSVYATYTPSGGGTTYNQAVAGSLPAPTGAVRKKTAKPLTGSAPAGSGAVSSRFVALQGVAGSMPAPSGTIGKAVGKRLSGAMGSPAGGLSKKTSRGLSGSLPGPSGALGTGYRTTQAVAGVMGTITGAVAGVFHEGGAAVRRVLGVLGSSFRRLIG